MGGKRGSFPAHPLLGGEKPWERGWGQAGNIPFYFFIFSPQTSVRRVAALVKVKRKTVVNMLIVLFPFFQMNDASMVSFAAVFREVTQRFLQRVSLGECCVTSITVCPEMYAIRCMLTFDKSHKVSHSV